MSLQFPDSQAIPADHPVSLHEARTLLTDAIDRAHRAAIPSDTVVAALLVELVPRLVGALGVARAATMLHCLAEEIRADAGTSNRA